MRLVYKYKPPCSFSCSSRSIPVKSVFTGSIRYHCIYVLRMSYGRIYWVVPRIGFVASLPFDADLLDIFSDGIFYNFDELYNSLSDGGFHYVLDMDKECFYSYIHW